jgi:hypothetical protein
MLDAATLTLPAVRLSLVSAGVFFLAGLLTGVWKYWHIARTENAQAPAYVDIAHRAALLYSFAALLLAQFAALSAFSAQVNLWAAAVPLALFAAAIVGYVVHGFLNDTDNQLRRPHKVGGIALPRHALLLFMLLLMAGEIGGFAVLFVGLLKTLGWV